MPCGCGKNKTRTYLVTTASGAKVEKATLNEAIQTVRSQGGHYEVVKK